MEATHIPERWVTSRHQALGRADAIAQAWIDAGRPGMFEDFKKGYEAHQAELSRPSAGPAELITELQFAGRLLYMAHRQMSVQQRALYARNAHAAKLIEDDELRETERAAVLTKFGGARA